MHTLAEIEVPWLTAAGFVLVGYVVFLLFEDYSIRAKYNFPNLVPGLPLIGNALQMPSTDHGPFLSKLAETYGEMYVFSHVHF